MTPITVHFNEVNKTQVVNIKPGYLNHKFIEKVGLEFKKDKYVSNMSSGKATLVTINYKVELVAKAVDEAIDNKDPPNFEVGPARKAVTSVNHSKNKDEILPPSNNVMDEEVNKSTNEEYHFSQSAHLNCSTLKYWFNDNKNTTSTTETIPWGMD